ncbi:hypothetical protein FNV43_RR21626 [Rhamnella rubrinervis]|uniref:PAP/OAS1 substrate-binding-related domain-containing protein n=1 Tax=Rhamnella rubrinervis TaxID=2594499 RepID=A0A8K0DQ15_9ROSA|nr:hypothetical protein FNV43_RR21626 [Rhamnella rubrinervis]
MNDPDGVPLMTRRASLFLLAYTLIDNACLIGEGSSLLFNELKDQPDMEPHFQCKPSYKTLRIQPDASESDVKKAFTKVFSFGSAPLKTYLLDGDIDLTTLSHQNGDEDLARNVKIVKCTVKNIAVDISFIQLVGLCTLCFLEQVLYRFLEYYSMFDWDRYCVSINGLVAISSLTEVKCE